MKPDGISGIGAPFGFGQGRNPEDERPFEYGHDDTSVSGRHRWVGVWPAAPLTVLVYGHNEEMGVDIGLSHRGGQIRGATPVGDAQQIQAGSTFYETFLPCQAEGICSKTVGREITI